MTATYVLPTNFKLSVKDYVYRACETLIAEHPALSAIPAADDTQEPYFVRLPQIDLDQTVSFEQRKTSSSLTESADGEPSADLELQALLEREHNTPFKAPNTYWRLCVLTDRIDARRFTAVFVYHHALGDGTSGKAVHQTFLRALDSADSDNRETKSIIQPPAKPLLPNIEQIHPMPLSFLFLAKKIFQEKIYSRRDPGLWSGGNIRTEGQTHIRLVPFSKSLVTSLRKICRQENTSITALLHTSLARSLFAHLPPRYTILNCTGAISCRRWLPDIITDEVMGVYVNDFDESYARSTTMSENIHTFPWAEARRSKQGLEAAIQRQGSDAGPNLLKFVNNFQQELCLSKVGSERYKSYEISNVGIVSCEAVPEKPRIEGMVFSQCTSVIGNAIEVSVITGGDGCMVLAVTWQDGVVEENLIQGAIAFLKDEFKGLAKLK